jgi:antirestriction protein ArdC
MGLFSRAAKTDRVRRWEFFAATGATVRHGRNRAFDSRASDHIPVAPFESFQPGPIPDMGSLFLL